MLALVAMTIVALVKRGVRVLDVDESGMDGGSVGFVVFQGASNLPG